MKSAVVVIGAGVIGLSVAWRAARAGLEVTVLDPVPGGGASHVAAGMLTPVGELRYGEEPLLRLGIESRDRYPAFAADLEEASGLTTGLRSDGNLEVAFDASDLAFLDDLRKFQASLGLHTEALSGRECRRLEPMLAPSVRGGILAPDDGSVDPRRLTAALLVAAERAGVRLVRESAAALLVEHDRAVGVRLGDGSEVRAADLVLAAGCHSHLIDGLPPGAVPPIRPVKGQVLRLRARSPFLGRAVRGVVKGSTVYLVPRGSGTGEVGGGEIVVGATQEEQGYDTSVTAGGIWQLLRDARELLPGLTELEFTEAIAGLRPGSPDNAPLLGRSALPGLTLATGHFRNGVLLTPITADVITALLTGTEVPAVAAPFTPERFA
jgi:glycine oxidase